MGLFGAKDQNQSRFHDDLATALDSGMPIRSALKTVSGDSAFGSGSGPYRVAMSIERDIGSGGTLADALAAEPAVFSAFERHVVAAGEKGGRLVEALRRLAKHFARRGTLRDSIGYGMLYPAGLVHLAFLLPPLSKLISGGIFAYAKAAFLPIAVLWAVVAGCIWLSRTLGKSGAFDRAVLSVPWFGETARAAANLELVSSLGALYGAGVPVLEALESAAQSVRNRVVGETARRAREAVREGASLSEGFAPYRGVLSPLFLDAVRVGEASGKLEETFDRLERTLAEDLERRMRAAAVLLPVVAYLIVAAYIGYIVISFYSQMYSGLGDLTR